MRSNVIRFGLPLIAAWFVAGSIAQGQFVTRQVTVSHSSGAPTQYFVAPGMTQSQYLNNLTMTARALSTVPPWLAGYNPYPRPIINPYPPVVPPPLSPYGVNPYANPYAVDPGYANPYAPTTASTNPYSPTTTGSPYDTSAYNPYTPYNYNPVGGALSGQADVMRAYSAVVTGNEQARILREQAEQAKLDTKKKKFDLEMYIRANTPTYNDEQAKLAYNTLKRIQTNSNPAEIASGKSLNYLLDDIRKHVGIKAAMDPLPLDEDILQRINVTRSYGNVGILRNEGKITLPVALQEILTPEQQKELDLQTQNLYKNAVAGKINSGLLKDVATQMESVRDILTKKVNDFSTNQYMEARRFLSDFGDALTGIERGDVPTQIDFQTFVHGGKTVQEFSDYMVKNGLKFAPAVAGDENVYQAVYSAMVSYDVALNSQTPSTADAKDYAP